MLAFGAITATLFLFLAQILGDYVVFSAVTLRLCLPLTQLLEIMLFFGSIAATLFWPLAQLQGDYVGFWLS